MLAEEQMEYSILAHIGKGICWIFKPLGWGNWQATVASVTGLVAKENIVATMGILYGTGDVSVYALSLIHISRRITVLLHMTWLFGDVTGGITVLRMKAVSG